MQISDSKCIRDDKLYVFLIGYALLKHPDTYASYLLKTQKSSSRLLKILLNISLNILNVNNPNNKKFIMFRKT